MKFSALHTAFHVLLISSIVSSCSGSSGSANTPTDPGNNEEQEQEQNDNDDQEGQGEPGQDETTDDYMELSMDEIRIGAVPTHQRSEYMEFYEQTQERREPYGQVYVASYSDDGAERQSYLHVDEEGHVSVYTAVPEEEGDGACYRRAEGDEPNTLLHGGTFESQKAAADVEENYDFPVENMKQMHTVTVAASGYRDVGPASAEMDPRFVEWTGVESPEHFDIQVSLEQDRFGYLSSVSLESEVFDNASGDVIDEHVSIENLPARFLINLEHSTIEPSVFVDQRCGSTYVRTHQFTDGEQLAKPAGLPSYSIILSYDHANKVFADVENGQSDWLYVYNLELVEDENATGAEGTAGSESGVPVCYEVFSELTFRYNAWEGLHYALSEHTADETGNRGVATLELDADESPAWVYYFSPTEEGGYESAGYWEGQYLIGNNRYVSEEYVSEGLKELAASVRDVHFDGGVEALLEQRCANGS